MIDLGDKSLIIERRIIRELTQYAAQHKDGMHMHTLAAKYSRALSELPGGFPDFMEKMRTNGLIKVVYSEGGARTVWLNDQAVPMPLEKVWL